MTEPSTAPGKQVASLELSEIVAAYGRNVVVRDVSLVVPQHSVVALLGANGAGKTTLLRVAAGLLKPQSGEVAIGGVIATRETPSSRARRGVCLIPEGRGIFRSLTVAENLLLHTPPWVNEDHLADVFEVFPVLGTRLKQVAGRLSGGQQQMLALARIYLAEPQVVLLDEVSMGLAPIVIDQIFETLTSLSRRGVALLIVEQYVNRALEMCDHVYMMNRGEITSSGAPSDLDQEAILEGYLGRGGAS